MTLLLLSVSPALSPAGTGMGWEGVMGWTRMAWRGVLGRYRGMGTGRRLGCLGREGEGGWFGWKVNGELDQFGVVMGNWTSSLGDDWQLG